MVREAEGVPQWFTDFAVKNADEHGELARQNAETRGSLAAELAETRGSLAAEIARAEARATRWAVGLATVAVAVLSTVIILVS